jgi:hypothetical protein
MHFEGNSSKITDSLPGDHPTHLNYLQVLAAVYPSNIKQYIATKYSKAMRLLRNCLAQRFKNFSRK